MSSALALVPSNIVNDPTFPAIDLKYLAHLLSYADPDGVTWVSRDRSARELGVSTRTITAIRSRLVRRALLRREGGGFRGMTTIMRVLVRLPRDVARRARAAVVLAAQDRAAAGRGLYARRKKGEARFAPTTPQGGLGPDRAGLTIRHPFSPDDYGLSCASCSLPPGRHAA